MKRSILFSLLIVGLLLTGSHAFGWPGDSGMRGDRDCSQRTSQRLSAEERQQRQEMQQQRMAVVLDLNESQQQQLQTLHEQRRQQQQALRAEMQASRDQLHEVARSKDADEERIRAAVQQQAELKTRMMVDGAEHRRQIAAVLTPEQQQKFEQLRELKGNDSCGKRGQARNCNAGDGTSGAGAGCGGGRGSRF